MIYIATLMPYLLVFYDGDNDWNDPWYIFQWVVDLLFWMDLFVNMFSCYYDDDGVLITNRKKVFLNYLKSWFILDLLACIPFDQVDNTESGQSNTKTIQLVRLSKLPRLYRIIKIAKIFKIFRIGGAESQFLDMFELNSGVMRLVSLLCFVMLAVHLMGCLWYFEAKLDGFAPDTWVTRLIIYLYLCKTIFRNDLIDSDNLTIYLISIYYALTTLATVGYGDITPNTDSKSFN